ncbi:MAG: respiratory nitrate reductase subunit gamma [Syntrophomonadaceae bacterium]
MILGLSVYIAVILFFGLSAYQVIKYARMPLHGRMELYPVPQEKGRHTYGGSYMEEPEWWSKPRQVSKLSELTDMLKEMLFIKKLFDNQRSLWWSSYSFHLGIYFLIGWMVLLVIGVLTEFAGAPVSLHASLWTGLIYYLTIVTGVVGFAIATAGEFFLLVRRVFNPVLKKYTTPQEYFNLVLLLATLVSGIIVWGPDLTFNTARQVTAQILTLSVVPNTALVVHLILLEVMLVYIPPSKMGHYVGKYFTYHKILWENEPNTAGSSMESKVKAALNQKARTSWAASHIEPSSAPEA